MKKTGPKVDQMGYFGNVWVRKLYFPTTNTEHNGHKHHHDHISLLATGSLKVEVEGYEPTYYEAPTFITIAAEHMHKLTPLEDNTTVFCVFALRDENGELTDLYNEDTSPYRHKKD